MRNARGSIAAIDAPEVDVTERTALLIIDMVSPFDFPRGAALRRAALTMAPRLAGLKRKVKKAGGLCVYANDNFADWASDFDALVQLARQSPGRAVLEAVTPEHDDPHVLKPRHSAFHQTALECVLDAEDIKRVLVTGVATESCVLATALDARIRELEVAVISDCVASSSPSRRAAALSVLRYGNIPVISAARALSAPAR